MPPQRDSFEDVYIVYELMEHDLYGVLTSGQELTKEHCMVCVWHCLNLETYNHLNIQFPSLFFFAVLLVPNPTRIKVHSFG